MHFVILRDMNRRCSDRQGPAFAIQWQRRFRWLAAECLLVEIPVWLWFEHLHWERLRDCSTIAEVGRWLAAANCLRAGSCLLSMLISLRQTSGRCPCRSNPILEGHYCSYRFCRLDWRRSNRCCCRIAMLDEASKLSPAW